MASNLYRKHDSFVEVRAGSSLPDTLARIARLEQRLDSLGLDAYRRRIVAAACSELLRPESVDGQPFTLQPYVLDEIARLDDDRLPRYLFYRYRYEMYPQRFMLDEYPPCLQVEPSSICNYRCVFCYQTDSALTAPKAGHMGLMSLDTFKRVVDEADGRIEAITLASRGEPLMNKSIVPMLRYAAGKFLAMKINTNAWFLDEERAHAILQADVNTLVFSADAAAEPSYSQFRVNGKLDRVLENVKLFRRVRETHYPNARTITRVSGVKVPGTPNLDEMERFWGDLVDQVAFVSYNPWENTYERPVNDVSAPCSDLWRRMFVWWDGRTNPCDVDYKSTLAVGTAASSGLSALWQAEGYATLRDRHTHARRSECSPCNRCTVV